MALLASQRSLLCRKLQSIQMRVGQIKRKL